MNRDRIDSAYERAEDALCRQLEAGQISQNDFNDEMRALARDYRDAIDEGAAEAADRWRAGW